MMCFCKCHMWAISQKSSLTFKVSKCDAPYCYLSIIIIRKLVYEFFCENASVMLYWRYKIPKGFHSLETAIQNFLPIFQDHFAQQILQNLHRKNFVQNHATLKMRIHKISRILTDLIEFMNFPGFLVFWESLRIL